jgi:hypothetical protein
MIKQLMYTSRASKNISVADIEAILDVSRRYNAAHNITGLLIVKDRVFMQVLEGEPEAVANLFQRIKADPRHEVTLYISDMTEQRSFPDWSMGMKDAKDLSSDALRNLDKIEVAAVSDNPAEVHAMLQHFLDIEELTQ